MLERLRETLVKTYVGTIGLGYLLAQCVLHLAGIFTTPAAKWITQREYGDLLNRHPLSPSFYWFEAGSEAAGFLVLLLVWYLLVRWLYYKPVAAPSE